MEAPGVTGNNDSEQDDNGRVSSRHVILLGAGFSKAVGPHMPALIGEDHAETSIVGIALTTGAALLANTVFDFWWLDSAAALGIAGWAVLEGCRAWTGIATCSSSAPACLHIPGPSPSLDADLAGRRGGPDTQLYAGGLDR